MKKYYLLFILIIIFAGCTNKDYLDLSQYEKIIIKNKILSEEDRLDIVDAFSTLEKTYKSISDDPSFTIYAYPDKDGEKYDLYSVFLPLKLLYPGDHFEALANNVKGKRSKCYELDEYSLELLSSYK